MWRIIGQDDIVSLLNSSLEKNNLSHAFLITGPPHVGKMTLAIDIAQAINCENADSPCGECSSCLKIKQGKHADVQVISLTSGSDEEEDKVRTEISIDDIRQMQHAVSLPPFEGKRRAFIIEDAEYMSLEAANCLLKTLEEPATGAVFILLTTNASLIPETVASRCQMLSLNPMPAAQIAQALVAAYHVDSEQASILSKLSRGCFGWALSAAQDEKVLGSYREKRDRVLVAMSASLDERFNYAGVLSTQFVKDRASVYEVLDIWLDVWRDMLLLRVGLRSIIHNIDIEETLISWAEVLDIHDIRDAIRAIQDAKEQLQLNANSRLVLEVMMLDVPARMGNIVKR
jgi:DNA polymerase-3 subunit delta'